MYIGNTCILIIYYGRQREYIYPAKMVPTPPALQLNMKKPSAPLLLSRNIPLFWIFLKFSRSSLLKGMRRGRGGGYLYMISHQKQIVRLLVAIHYKNIKELASLKFLKHMNIRFFFFPKTMF